MIRIHTKVKGLKCYLNISITDLFFKTDILKPAYKITGKEEKWDKTESNKFLYATTDIKEALELGFASSINQLFLLNRFQSKANIFVVSTERISDKKSVLSLKFWQYSIKPNQNDGWQKVNNKFNNNSNEWKTLSDVVPISAIEIIGKEYLKDKIVIFANSDRDLDNFNITRPGIYFIN